VPKKKQSDRKTQLYSRLSSLHNSFYVKLTSLTPGTANVPNAVEQRKAAARDALRKVTAMNFDTDNRSYMQPMYADDSRGWESDSTLTRDDGYDWLTEVANRLHTASN
jgi:hypothetical protein